MTKFSHAFAGIIPLIFALLGGSCAILPFTKDEKVPQASQQETLKPDPPPQDQSYEVVKGDTLSAIALKTTGDARNWKTIARFNKLSDPNTLSKGQVLVIPHYLISSQASAPAANSKTSPAGVQPPDIPVPASRPLTQESDIPQESDRPAHAPHPDSEKSRGQTEIGGWLIIRGTNYPREITTAPNSASAILTQAWPGTRLRYVDRIDGWYKVITDKGKGYLNPNYATVQP